MSRMIAGWMAIALLGAGNIQAAGPQSLSPVPPAAAAYRSLMDRYCTTCHNENLHTAGVILNKLDLAKVGEGAAVLERVMRKLEAG